MNFFFSRTLLALRTWLGWDNVWTMPVLRPAEAVRRSPLRQRSVR